MFLYERVRFYVLFMTILTDNYKFLLLNVDIGNIWLFSRHVVFRSVSDNVHEVQVFTIYSCIISEVISGSLSARSRKRSRGGALVSPNQETADKIGNSIAMC